MEWTYTCMLHVTARLYSTIMTETYLASAGQPPLCDMYFVLSRKETSHLVFQIYYTINGSSV